MCAYTGEWPIVINDRTAFSVGNHSVSIAAADSIGLTAQNVELSSISSFHRGVDTCSSNSLSESEFENAL